MANWFKRNKKQEIYKPLSNSYDWGMNMRSCEARQDYSLQNLLDILNSNNITSMNKAMSLSTVYAATELISNSIASLPIKIKKDKQEISHNILDVLDTKLLTTKFVLIKTMLVDMLINGNGYAYIKRGPKGVINNIIYLNPSNVFIDYNEQTQELYYKIRGYKNIPNVVEPINILHIYKNSEDGIKGKGFKDYGSRAIQQMMQMDSAASQLYSDGMNIEGYYTSDTIMSHKQQEDMLTSIKEQQELGRRRIFLPSKFTFISGTNSAADSQLIENRLFSLQEVCRYFNISPILVGDYTKGTNSSSIEDSQLHFLYNTLLPYLSILEQEFNKKLLLPSERNLVIDFDENSLLRTNKTSLSSYLSTLTNNGIMSINEARDILGLQEREDADELIIPYTNIEHNKVSEE